MKHTAGYKAVYGLLTGTRAGVTPRARDIDDTRRQGDAQSVIDACLNCPYPTCKSPNTGCRVLARARKQRPERRNSDG